jgi:AbrB family looped-hinge helix DNA binding protein
MTKKGQITINAGLRQALGLGPGDRVIMSLQPDNSIRIQRIMSLGELIESLPLAVVPPIDWKAAREEMAEEIADKVFCQIAEANERRNQHEIH